MKYLSILFLIVIAMLINSVVLAEENTALSSLEKQISIDIDRHHKADLKLLKKVVNTNSGTMNFVGVKNVGKIFEKELIALGFKTEWIDGEKFNRAGHLYASFGNDKANHKTKLLLIGHLDTVFSKDDSFQQYKVIDQQSIAGPGITDMKGGDVIIISSLRALKNSGVLKNLNIRILMMGDEEKRGKPYQLATAKLIEAGKWADVALGFEDGDGNPKTAVISRRGAVSWQLKVKGRAAHSSQIFRKGYGDGAIFEAARILNQFRTTLSTEPNLTFNPGVIVGGTEVNYDSSLTKGDAFGKSNVIAQTTIVSGDIRALSPAQLANAKSVMQKIVSENLNKTSATLAFFDGYPPMAPNKGNRKLLSIYSQASIDLGFGEVVAVDPRKAGAADVSFVASYVDMALDGLGLMGKGGHTIKEVADISSLSSQSKRAAIVMYRLSQSLE